MDLEWEKEEPHGNVIAGTVGAFLGWLGHSDISTTANIYSHFLYSAKRDMADSIEAALSGKPGKPAC